MVVELLEEVYTKPLDQVQRWTAVMKLFAKQLESLGTNSPCVELLGEHYENVHRVLLEVRARHWSCSQGLWTPARLR